MHGFSDHINRYYELFPSLAARGIVVYGFDQRGWGRSVRGRADWGVTGPTSLVMADLARFLEAKIAEEPVDAPMFVMGHSMGGAEVLTLASEGAEHDDSATRIKHRELIGKVRGWLLESAFLDFYPGQGPHRLTVLAGRLAAKVLPRYKVLNVVPEELFSRDPDVVRSIREDSLCHKTGTLEGVAGLLDRSAKLRDGRVRLVGTGTANGVRSMIMFHGTDDQTSSFAAAKHWWDTYAQDVPDGEFRAIEGAYHQLHAEFGRDEFYRTVGNWILARAGTEETATKADSPRDDIRPETVPPKL